MSCWRMLFHRLWLVLIFITLPNFGAGRGHYSSLLVILLLPFLDWNHLQSRLWCIQVVLIVQAIVWTRNPLRGRHRLSLSLLMLIWGIGCWGSILSWWLCWLLGYLRASVLIRLGLLIVTLFTIWLLMIRWLLLLRLLWIASACCSCFLWRMGTSRCRWWNLRLIVLCSIVRTYVGLLFL